MSGACIVFVAQTLYSKVSLLILRLFCMLHGNGRLYIAAAFCASLPPSFFELDPPLSSLLSPAAAQFDLICFDTFFCLATFIASYARYGADTYVYAIRPLCVKKGRIETADFLETLFHADVFVRM